MYTVSNRKKALLAKNTSKELAEMLQNGS